MVQTKINRILIVADAVFRRVARIAKKNNKQSESKLVLIIFQQAFGDSILFSSTLDAYCKLYSKSNGYQIKLLALPSVCNFMKDVLVVPHEIELVPTDFKKFVSQYSYYKKKIQEYDGRAEFLIVPGSSLSADVFSTACRAKKILAYYAVCR